MEEQTTNSNITSSENETSPKTENKMGVMPVNRLLITMSLPMIASMLIQALYNVVDSVFVSRISEEALSAVSMAFPMQNLLIGVATGLGVGTNALLSRALGCKDQKRANQMAMHGIFLSAISYVIFLILGITIARLFFVAQGADKVIADYGQTYLSIVMCASFGILFEIMFERLLQSTGKTIYTMFTQGTGAIINIVFDPIFIFGLGPFPEMGIAGAATATVMGQIVAALMAVFFNMRVNGEIQIDFRKFKAQIKTIGEILYIGIPSIIMIAMSSVMTFGMNRILVGFSSTAVAVFGVYYRLQSFAFMPIFGLNNGMVPIIAYNYGAAKTKRITRTLQLSILYGTLIMILAFLIAQLLTEPLLALFNASEEMMAIGIVALKTISLGFLLAGANVVVSSFFQAMGNGVYSMIVSIFRQLVLLLPLAYIFSLTGNVDLVWLSFPIAEALAFALGMYLLYRIYRKIIRPLREAHPED